MNAIVKSMLEHPFFKNFQAGHVELLSKCAVSERFAAGGYLFRAGQTADRLYLIQSGEVAVVLQLEGEEPVPIMILGAGGVVGWSWLFPPYHWRFGAMVMEDTSAITLDSKCIMEKCKEDYQLGYELMWRCAQMIGERLDATRAQLLSFMRSG